MQRLAGKTALVTGGNTGIGRGVALAFAREGADIAVIWNDREEETRTLEQEVSALGRRVLALRCDLTREADVISAFDRTVVQFGALDVLVNNAGRQLAKPLVDMSVDDWDGVMNVNLRGAFLCAREAARRMIPRKSGRIINTCSQLAYLGREEYTAYSASKGGLVALTRALARELVPHGILVNGVGPGLIDTGFDPLSDERKRLIAQGLPLKRLCEIDDVTAAYVFLANDESRFFCGQVIHPNGGQIMH